MVNRLLRGETSAGNSSAHHGFCRAIYSMHPEYSIEKNGGFMAGNRNSSIGRTCGAEWIVPDGICVGARP